MDEISTGRRSFAKGVSLLAAVAGMNVGASFAATASGNTDDSSGTSAIDVAWRRYFEALQEIRRIIFSSPLIGRTEVSDGANDFFLQAQASAYTMVMAPRQDYPRFYVNSIFEPLVFNWWLPNPDFYYRYAWLDGARTFRIWGKKSNSQFVDFQVSNRFIDVPNPLPPKNYELDNFRIEDDGSFEIIASPTRVPGNWIQLDPGSANNMIGVREGLYDWARERPIELHIETLDNKPARPQLLNEQEFIRRLEGSIQFIKFCVENFAMMPIRKGLEMAPVNQFYEMVFAKNSGAHASARYVPAIYDLKPDEALIIEMEKPSARYWGIQLGDVWLRTTDYVYHQSSLNGYQAKADGDGKYRFVLSQKDPGVANWLDPVDIPIGFMQLRQYFSEKSTIIPATRKVMVANIRKFLPEDTALVGAAERAEQLQSRSRSALALYHY